MVPSCAILLRATGLTAKTAYIVFFPRSQAPHGIGSHSNRSDDRVQKSYSEFWFVCLMFCIFVCLQTEEVSLIQAASDLLTLVGACPPPEGWQRSPPYGKVHFRFYFNKRRFRSSLCSWISASVLYCDVKLYGGS